MSTVSGRPFKGSKLVRGVKQTPGKTLVARSDASAQKGLYVTAKDFEALKRQIADPAAASEEERQRIVAALQIVRDEADQATETARLIEDDDNPSTGKVLAYAADDIARRAEQSSPEQGLNILATLSNQADQLPIESKDDEDNVASIQRTVSRSTASIMKQLQARETQLRGLAERPAAVRTLAFGNNPEVATAAPRAVDEPPPDSPRSATVPRAETDEGEESEEEQATPRQSVLVSGVQAGLNYGRQMLGWSQTQSTDVQADVEEGNDLADDIANESLDAMAGELGEDAEDDEAAAAVIAEDLLGRSAALADTEDGADIAAAVLVSGVQILNDMADQAHPEAREAVRAASAEVRAGIAQTPPSTVKSAFEGGFRTDPDETPRPGANRVDGLAYPHVATAEAQHAEARAVESSDSDEDEPGAARGGVDTSRARNVFREYVATELARNAKYTAQQKRNLNRMALNPSRTLGGPPPPLRSAAVVTTLTKNLEDNPRVAALVQRGLLKTEDVLSKPYVQAMEKRLREQEITKEVEGRDPRYRPRTARQAYRPPVNVVPAGQPGVYRYRRPRFAQPQFSQPVQNP